MVTHIHGKSWMNFVVVGENAGKLALGDFQAEIGGGGADSAGRTGFVYFVNYRALIKCIQGVPISLQRCQNFEKISSPRVLGLLSRIFMKFLVFR